MKKILLILGCCLCSITLMAQVLQLRSPIKDDSWPGYSVQRIRWTSENIDNIKIEASLDSGRTWTTLIGSYPASAQFYEWEVPNKVSDSCFIRLTDVTNGSVSSSNFKNNPFKIPVPGITVDSLPSMLKAGTAYPITWVSSGVRKMNLYISFDNKQSYTKIADTVPATLFYYNWRIPAQSTGTICHLKMENAENTLLFSESPISFSIENLQLTDANKFKGGAKDGHSTGNNRIAQLQIKQPAKKDSAYGSVPYAIRWIQNNVEQVNLAFSADSGVSWKTIVTQYPAAGGVYEWPLPNTPTQKGIFRIADSKDSTVLFDLSDSLFTIRKKTVTITEPITSHKVYHQTVLPIAWNSGGINWFRLRIRYDNRDSLIRDSIPANNEMVNWVIPTQLNSPFKLVLMDLSDSTALDSTALLTPSAMPQTWATKYRGGAYDGHSALSNQKAILQLLTPKNNDTLSIAARYTIRWKANNLERINIDYSSNNGSSWTRVANNLAAIAESYEWRTPTQTADQCKIRLSDASDSTLFSVNTAVFVLAPKKINNTTDSLHWYKGSSKQLEWLAAGVDSIRIQYRYSSTHAWMKLRDSIPATWEAYNWILPENIGDSLQIKLTDITDSSVTVIKTYVQVFNTLVKQIDQRKFKGGSFDGHSQRSNINKIIVQRPVENEILTGGTIYTIKWSSVNLEDSILLQFSVDSGANWITIARALASAGQYEWKIPTTLSQDMPEIIQIKSDGVTPVYKNNSTNSSKCLIRALDISSGNLLVGISSKPFTITTNDAPKKASLQFAALMDTVYSAGMFIKLKALSQNTNNPIRYLLNAATATLRNDTVFIAQAGPITIGAYVDSGAGFQRSDTLFQTICVNPAKPLIQYQGQAAICGNDSLLLTSTGIGEHQWYKDGLPITGASNTTYWARSTGNYTDTIRVNGCKAGSVITTITIASKPAQPVIIVQKGKQNACVGDSILLASNGTAKHQWLLNGVKLAADSSATLFIKQTGSYRTITGSNGCVSDTSLPIQITLNPRPDTLKASNQILCQFSTATPINLTASPEHQLIWYTSANGGTGSTQTPIPHTNQVGVQTYFVSQQHNTTGCESARTPIQVRIQQTPDTPTISRMGNQLISTSATQYRWLLNNNYINGAVSRTQNIIAKGLYRVEIRKDSSCWVSSSPYLVQTDTIAINSQQDYTLKVYPNPAQTLFFLQIELDKRISGYIEIIITDISGQALKNIKRYVLNERMVRIPISIKLTKGVNNVQVRINGYSTKNVQVLGL